MGIDGMLMLASKTVSPSSEINRSLYGGRKVSVMSNSTSDKGEWKVMTVSFPSLANPLASTLIISSTLTCSASAAGHDDTAAHSVATNANATLRVPEPNARLDRLSFEVNDIPATVNFMQFTFFSDKYELILSIKLFYDKKEAKVSA